MLSYFMQCCVILYYPMLCFVMLCYAMLCYVVLRFIVLYCIILYYSVNINSALHGLSLFHFTKHTIHQPVKDGVDKLKAVIRTEICETC